MSIFSGALRSVAANDAIVTALQKGRLTHQNICFDEIRGIGKHDHDLKGGLKSGTKILSSMEELAQYLYSYGPMTQRQWRTWVPTKAFANTIVAGGRLHVVDHGCGQGTSLAAFLDREPLYRSRVAAITLIEPSRLALERAGRIAQCYCPNVSISRVNKKFDDLTTDELRSRIPIDATIHILSQVLDIDGYDQFSLLTKALRSIGEHHVVALSADRDFDGGTPRIEALDTALKAPCLRQWIEFLDEPKLERYSTSNTKGKPELRVRWSFSALIKPGFPGIAPRRAILDDDDIPF